MHNDLVVIDHLDPVHRTNAILIPHVGRVCTARVVLITPQGMAVHHVFGGELAVAMVELVWLK